MQITFKVDPGWFGHSEEMSRLLSAIRELESSPDSEPLEPCQCADDRPSNGREFGAGIDTSPTPDDRTQAGKKLFGRLKEQDMLGLAADFAEKRGLPKKVVLWSPLMCSEFEKFATTRNGHSRRN
jgi:hypothetical protein